VGSLNMDLVIRAARIPQPGETILGGAFHTVPGGKGANQAVAAARLGAHVAMVGRVGQDDFGAMLLDGLVAEGIDASQVIQDPEAATGVALIVVDDQGQNAIVVASGANARLSPAQVAAGCVPIAAANALLLQLESPLAAIEQAAQLATVQGVTVILNPAPARALPPDFLALVDVLVPNEIEAALLTGLPVADLAQARAAAAALREMGAGTVVLTLGERGALLATGEDAQLCPAFSVEPVDTTAAGDAFVAGLAVALGEGQPLIEAVRWGTASGALATTVLGAQPSLPRREDVELLLGTAV
jgi:ribokinase